MSFIKYSCSISLLLFLLLGCTPTKPASSGDGEVVKTTLAEKLGYDKEAKLVLLHADDLGVSHSVNAASIKALNQGPIRSASLMMPTTQVEEIVAFAKQQENLDLGLHLTVTSEWADHKWGPVAPVEKVPSLVDEHGHLPPACTKDFRPEEIEIELRAQLAKAKEMGITPTHFDSHMGCLFYLHPGIFEAYARLAHENNVPCVANKNWIPNTGKYRAVIETYADNLVMVDAVYEPRIQDFEQEGGMAAYYANSLRNLEPGLSYFMIHPGYDDAEMQQITGGTPGWGALWRQRDFDFFISQTAREIIASENIKVVTWKEIATALSL